MANDKRHLLPEEVAQRTVFPEELTPANVRQKLGVVALKLNQRYHLQKWDHDVAGPGVKE